jgi:hypothetical protein
VVDLVGLGRARQDDRMAAPLQLFDQLARALHRLHLADQLEIKRLL